MVVREKFELELQELKDMLIELSACASDSIRGSFEALEKQDMELALEIIERDERADLLEEEINEFAIQLITRQQPVAIDLRRIIAAIKIASDIERMADFGVNIAKAAIRIGEKPFIMPLTLYKEMHDVTLEMMNLSIQAFKDDDVVLARKIVFMDEKVDILYGQCMKELLKLSHENIQQVTQLSLIARFLERTADHTTNIAENIYYLVRGRYLDLND